MPQADPPGDPIERLAELARRTDAWLEQALDRRAPSWPHQLTDALRYALLGGGKRLRPALCQLWCEAAGGEPGHAMPAAGALECIHAFSLVHDDLPAMDDDDLRRGRPTLHIHAGEAMAILAGDLLQTLAFDLVCEAGIDAARSHAWTAEIARATEGMIAGQVLDTLGGHDPSLDELGRLRATHTGKTGALILAACRCGAIAGGHALEPASAYGRAVGLMFQAVDDLLDVEGDATTVGKRTGKDADAGKLTYPGMLGVEGTRQEIDRLLDKAVEAARAPGVEGGTLIALARWLAERRH